MPKITASVNNSLYKRNRTLIRDQGLHAKPLVSEDLWAKANKVLSARLPGHSFVRLINGNVYLLSGLIKCGQCGSHLVNAHTVGRVKDKFFYYECARSRQQLGCSFKRLSAPMFDNEIIKYFKRASENQEVIVKAIGNAILESQVKFDKIEAKLNEKEKELSTLRHEAEKLIDLAMNDKLAQGPTYKTKLSGIESKIAELEDETDKLRAQKQVAQMDASSGKFLYSNIRLAMQYLDQAPPVAQQSLLKALINDIIIYDDKITINMYIEQALADTLPKYIDQKPAQNGKSPTPTISQDKALALTPCVSQGRPLWGRWLLDIRNLMISQPTPFNPMYYQTKIWGTS